MLLAKLAAIAASAVFAITVAMECPKCKAEKKQSTVTATAATIVKGTNGKPDTAINNFQCNNGHHWQGKTDEADMKAKKTPAPAPAKKAGKK